MLRFIIFFTFTTCSLSQNLFAQEFGRLRPLYYETTDIGEYYRKYFKELSEGLGSKIIIRTFTDSTFPELTSIARSSDSTYTLYYRAFEGRYKTNVHGDTIAYKKPKKILKGQTQIDASLARDLQKIFSVVISDSKYQMNEIIITHPTYYYFYTQIPSQGTICGKAQLGLFTPLYERLINIHNQLILLVTDIEKKESIIKSIKQDINDISKQYR